VCFLCSDASTIKNLELIQNARDPESGHCLYGVLNHTKTAGGGTGNSLSLRFSSASLVLFNVRLILIARNALFRQPVC